MWLRRKIAGLLAWVGKVTLLFAFISAGISVALHALVWLKTGEWPATFVLGEPLGETLRDMGVGVPSSSWVMLQSFLSWMLEQPTWLAAFLAAVAFGLLLVTMSDSMERSIHFELRNRMLNRDRRAGGGQGS
jgi:hypothetical protein